MGLLSELCRGLIRSVAREAVYTYISRFLPFCGSLRFLSLFSGLEVCCRRHICTPGPSWNGYMPGGVKLVCNINMKAALISLLTTIYEVAPVFAHIHFFFVCPSINTIR